MNAITAYMLSGMINFSKIADEYALFGFEQYVGRYYGVITSIGGFVILYLLLRYMYKNKTFIKI